MVLGEAGDREHYLGQFNLSGGYGKSDFFLSGSEGRIRDVGAGKGRFDFRSFSDDRDIDVYSAALEYEVTPVKDWGLVFGYGYYWLNKDEGNDNDGSFLIGTYYDIFKSTRIRGSAAKKIRFPSIRQLYDVDGGNPGLTTEKSYNYEVGSPRQKCI